MTDKELKEHVENALEWESRVDQTDIGVAVDKGVVTLHGSVGSYGEVESAERVALGVYGVKAVANDLKVRLGRAYGRTDTEIAQEVVAALERNTLLPADRIAVAVTNGWVTLKGTVECQYQKDAAVQSTQDLTGVKGIANHIIVTPKVSASDIQTKIEAACATFPD